MLHETQSLPDTQQGNWVHRQLSGKAPVGPKMRAPVSVDKVILGKQPLWKWPGSLDSYTWKWPSRTSADCLLKEGEGQLCPSAPQSVQKCLGHFPLHCGPYRILPGQKASSEDYLTWKLAKRVVSEEQATAESWRVWLKSTPVGRMMDALRDGQPFWNT